MKIIVFLLAILGSPFVFAEETTTDEKSTESAPAETGEQKEPEELVLTDEERRSLDTSTDAEYGGSLGY